MSRVLLLTARDAVDGDGFAPARAATALAADHEVTLVLLEDAVAGAREGHAGSEELRAAVEAGVVVLAEEDALVRRAVTWPTAGVKPTSMAAVVDLLLDGSDRQAWL